MWKTRRPWKDRRKDRTDMPMEAVQKQLEHIAREGGFKAALLTTEEGLTVVDIESELDSDALAALAGFAWDMNRNAVDMTGLEDIDQITLGGENGDSILCRSFEVSGQPVVLVAIAGVKTPYRDLTDRAVEGIRRILV